MSNLCMLGYDTTQNGMLAAFAERWHLETSSSHLPHSEITITLDDVACLLHLPIRGTLLCHNRLTKTEALKMFIVEKGLISMRPLRRWRGHEGPTSGLDCCRDSIMRSSLRHWTQLFVDTSSTYTDVVYLTYLSDIACIYEYNWGAAVLVYSYHRLRKGCLWKGWILQHFPDIVGWGEVEEYTEVMPRASAFTPLRGNQVSDPYRRSLDRMAAEVIGYCLYDEHREAVLFDEICLYSGWLAAISTNVIRYLPERVMHVEGGSPRPAHEEILRANQAQLDHIEDLLPLCRQIADKDIGAIAEGLFPEGTASRCVLDDMIKMVESAFLYRRHRVTTRGMLDARGRASRSLHGFERDAHLGTQEDARHTQ
ncbi:protein MAINTENANCE OF MERISTEMS-like [Vicia villosa]|uniref:protein MAINTENANCE OF MERISTEMS-like n=1 Tax=Vicia villosa TaxID=3911 RepID=UPI00273C0285|nr:protein MAINTENANCE OF MERISTEMS-like [Vicia villosa]